MAQPANFLSILGHESWLTEYWLINVIDMFLKSALNQALNKIKAKKTELMPGKKRQPNDLIWYIGKLFY